MKAKEYNKALQYLFIQTNATEYDNEYSELTESYKCIATIMEEYANSQREDKAEHAIEFAKFFIGWRNKKHNKDRMTSYQMAYRQFIYSTTKGEEGTSISGDIPHWKVKGLTGGMSDGRIEELATEYVKHEGHIYRGKKKKSGDIFIDGFRSALKELRPLPTEVQDMITYAKHTHVNNGENDICKICGHDLRHPIHHRLLNPEN